MTNKMVNLNMFHKSYDRYSLYIMPRYSWNIFESVVKHHQPIKPSLSIKYINSK
jgi:hypothetical protein